MKILQFLHYIVINSKIFNLFPVSHCREISTEDPSDLLKPAVLFFFLVFLNKDS